MKKSLLALTALCALVMCAGMPLRAEEPKKDPAPKPAGAEGAKAAPPEAVDPYKVPEGADSAALVTFCKSVSALKSKAHSREEYMEHQQKARPAIQAACDLILTLEKGDATPNGRFARRSLLTMYKIGSGSNAKYVEDLKKYMTAQDIGTEDMNLLVSAGRGLEYADVEQAKDYYTFAGEQMAKSKVPGIVAYASRLKGIVRRLGLVAT